MSDWLFVWSLRILATLATSVVVFIGVFLVWESAPMLFGGRFGQFFTDASWHPTSGLFNLLPMIAGTLAVTLGAIVLAVPLGIGAAVFCHFYAPTQLATAYRRMLELMGGVPSVVYGFWGLMVLVPLIASVKPPGASLLAGILILALMILPTMALSADAALVAVPDDYPLAGASLGLSRWAIVRHIVLPAAKPGLYSGIILSMGRAVGETMAVLMVCGNQILFPKDLLQPVRTLTANIALEMAYAAGDHRSALFVSGLILVVLVLLLVLTAQLLDKRHIHGH